jgi:hypothetical protein
VAWETTCKSKDQDGLGIIDIESQNNALLLKFLDKFYNQADTPWVSLTWIKFYANTQTPPQHRSPTGSFWWKDVIRLFDKFESMASCSPNKGEHYIILVRHLVRTSSQRNIPSIILLHQKNKVFTQIFYQS